MADILVGSTKKREQAAVEAKPHGWALSFWAQGYRHLARPWVVARHVQRFCRPLQIDGLENFSVLSRPAIIIANHTSHFDTAIVLSILPWRLYGRTAVAAAADRFYREKLKGAWFSLRYNAFPITRHGGRAALSYSESLLARNWSLLIFPEGTRSRTGELLPFHPGPALLALRQSVPVLPIHIQGASDILPTGTKWSRPAAVAVRVGEPLVFGETDSVPDAVGRMEAAMRELAPHPASQAIPALT